MPPDGLMECGCCLRFLPEDEVPYCHNFRDGRDDMWYCQQCYDYGCDLDTCEVSWRLNPPSAPSAAPDEPTPDDMEYVYQSLGVPRPEEGSA